MKCPNCEKAELQINGKLSQGMGQQTIRKCPSCGTVVLASGEQITQVWTPDMVYA